MKTEYCPSCGAKNLYDLHRPKFCSSCGCDMSSSEASKFNVISKQTPLVENFSIDDPSGEDIYEVPKIDALQYEVDISSLKSKRTSIGRLAQEKKENPDQQPLGRRAAPKTREGHDPVAKSIKECLPSKESKEIT